MRQGNYRILYQVIRHELIVHLVKFGDRSKIY
ncbi:MAG: type II toxin-antitoxin system RelE family toxin [Opitutales bacterium]